MLDGMGEVGGREGELEYQVGDSHHGCSERRLWALLSYLSPPLGFSGLLWVVFLHGNDAAFLSHIQDPRFSDSSGDFCAMANSLQNLKCERIPESDL